MRNTGIIPQLTYTLNAILIKISIIFFLPKIFQGKCKMSMEKSEPKRTKAILMKSGNVPYQKSRFTVKLQFGAL